MNLNVFRLLVACLFCGGSALFAPPLLSQDKLSIPTDEAQEKVLESFLELYGERWKQAKTSAQRRALAEELLTKARESRTDAPTHFVLLRLTRDMAAMAGEVEMAFRAIDEAAARFQVDAFAMKAETLVRAAQAASTADQSKAIAERARAVIDQAVERDAFDDAQRVHEAAVAAVQNAEEWILSRELLVHYQKIEPFAAAYAGIRPALEALDTDPVDPKANLVVGQYYCFTRGNWDRGLPYLALGSDVRLQSLAISELEGPKTADDQTALGDGWWDLAPTMEDQAQLVRTRAAHWYRLAQPRLVGLVKVKVDERLKEIEPEPPPRPPPRAPPPPKVKQPKPSLEYYLWEWRAGGGKPFHLKLYVNGAVGHPDNTKHTWSSIGNQLTVRWPQGWVDTMTILPDGRHMRGRNQHGRSIQAVFLGTNLDSGH